MLTVHFLSKCSHVVWDHTACTEHRALLISLKWTSSLVVLTTQSLCCCWATSSFMLNVLPKKRVKREERGTLPGSSFTKPNWVSVSLTHTCTITAKFSPASLSEMPFVADIQKKLFFDLKKKEDLGSVSVESHNRRVTFIFLCHSEDCFWEALFLWSANIAVWT